jgi:hypothetical protein
VQRRKSSSQRHRRGSTLIWSCGFARGGFARGFRDRGYRVVASSRTHSAETPGFLATLHPVGRMGMVEEIAAGVLYLDTAACVSGEALHVDGVLMPVTGKLAR